MATSQHHSIVLAGIKPTGRPDLGNYLGSIRPAIELAERHRAFYFVADGHALTALRDPARLAFHIDDVAATWLALGLGPSRVIFYRQSRVPEIFELMWLLSCTTVKGLLNRAHDYKAAVALNRGAGRDNDADVRLGHYTYPLLMAADILAMDADLVPVGRDQLQHLEMARDIALAFNQGGLAYREAKEALIAALEDRFAAARVGFRALLADRVQLATILARGTADARRQAACILARVRKAVGIERDEPETATVTDECAIFGQVHTGNGCHRSIPVLA